MSERATHEDASTILTPQAVGDKSCGEVVVAGTGEVIEEVVTEEVATAEVVTEEAGNDKTESESQLEEGEFNETSAKQPQPTLSDQEETGKWISVSPAKIGRQVSITETNISILSPSSFSVLADEESTERPWNQKNKDHKKERRQVFISDQITYLRRQLPAVKLLDYFPFALSQTETIVLWGKRLQYSLPSRA
ncbi:unnamed protein product [Arabis nemorensis]|uniref:Uncharacterized protein n=1 Tax=Arabis nemorensis TaxID=586526 RepID=A0A565CB82_9BRAS|nr:unnamed protein product [Arabis nemorensis]